MARTKQPKKKGGVIGTLGTIAAAALPSLLSPLFSRLFQKKGQGIKKHGGKKVAGRRTKKEVVVMPKKSGGKRKSKSAGTLTAPFAGKRVRPVGSGVITPGPLA